MIYHEFCIERIRQPSLFHPSYMCFIVSTEAKLVNL